MQKTMRAPVFRAHLQSILKDNAIERFVSGQKKGTLNTKRLYKISHSDKIFKQKQERKGKDYGVALIVDVSGSMSERLADAIRSASQIIEQLNIAKVPVWAYTFSECTRQVYAHTEVFNKTSFKNDVMNQYRGGFLVCKGCNEYDCGADHKCQNTQKSYCSNGGTKDALALHLVSQEVHKRNKKNIIIVITDGQGDWGYSEHWHYRGMKLSELVGTKTVIARIRKAHEDTIVCGISLSGNFTDKVS